jgi:hypothetical protein
MWIFTRHGFISCTCAQKRDAKGKPMPGVTDTELFMVRARLRQHLERIQDAGFIPHDAPIIETEHNDYRFRVLLAKADFVEMTMMLAADVDYPNFKSEVMRKEGATEYERALHKVWSSMYAVQTAATGPGIYSGRPRYRGRAPGHDPRQTLLDSIEDVPEDNDSVSMLDVEADERPGDDDTQALPAVTGD